MNNRLLNELHDVFPPVEIALPTRGLFYADGVLAPETDPKRISVGTLGILDEFKYRDPFLLVSGSAINHLVNHICGTQILMPEELCEIDVETILIAARLASYGPNLKITHRCPKLRQREVAEGETPPDPPIMEICDHENTLPVDLHEFILRYGPLENESQFEVQLPRVGQTVYLKPTPYRTTIQIMRNVMGNRRKLDDINARQEDYIMNPEMFHDYEDLINLSTDLQIQTILDCIYAVRTRAGELVEDPKEIMAWIFELPKSDHDVIAKRIHQLTEEFRKISLINYVCQKCGQESEFNLQMNAEILFLVDSEDSEIVRTSSAAPVKNKSSFRTPSRISQRLP